MTAPDNRIVPGPGQESVWDYPRPPRVEPVSERIVVTFGARTIARTDSAFRVLETSHPPAYYLPISDFLPGSLVVAPGRSVCEFKGVAAYFDVVSGDSRAPAAAWTYPEPWPGYEELTGHVALYPGRMDQCTVNGEIVLPQPGSFYGGWITSRIVGPFKGGPGTQGW
jgi:uncharacterized protein (DUF427 family)